MRLVWSRRAISDLRDHCNFIARDRPRAGAEVEERILTAAERLREFPESGRDGAGQGTRSLVVSRTGLMLIYRLERDRVVVVTVRHQMQRPFQT